MMINAFNKYSTTNIIKPFLTVVLMVCSYAVHAQFSDSLSYHVKYAATGLLNKTNDGTSYLLNNNLRFNVNKKRLALNTAAGWIYGRQLGTLSNNDYTAVVECDLFKGIQRFYYWGLATYDKSYSLKITDRFQTGAGIAYKLIVKPYLLVVLSDGPLYEWSDLYNEPVYTTVRNSFRIKCRVTVKIVTLDATGFLQQSLTDAEDYIIKSNSSLSVKLNKWLSFTSSVTYNKLNRTRKENLFCNFGLSVEKYF